MLSSLSPILMLIAPPALAGEPSAYAWRWESGQERHYYVESRVRLPTAVELYARVQHEVLVGEWESRMILRCAASGRRDEQLCRIDDIALTAAPVDGEVANLAIILAEMDTALTGATLQLRLKADGRLGLVDLEGVAAPDARASEQRENLRNMMMRAMAGFDLALPQDAAGGTWKQKQNRIGEYPTSFGTLSNTVLEHHASLGAGGVLRIDSQGESTMVMNIVAPGAGAMAYNIYGVVGSVAEFDTAGGGLAFRSWYLTGETGSDALDYHAVFSQEADTDSMWRAYVQSGVIAALPVDGDRPDLGETSVNAFLVDGPLATAEALIKGADVASLVAAGW